jgi:hypothetical protein
MMCAGLVGFCSVVTQHIMGKLCGGENCSPRGHGAKQEEEGTEVSQFSSRTFPSDLEIFHWAFPLKVSTTLQ